MSLDREQIELRLRKLQEYYEQLQIYRTEAAKSFDEQKLIDAVERNLQLAIESVIDIGEILIANLKLDKPQTLKDVPAILVKESIIPRALGDKLSLAAGFRNILIHDYLDIDESKVNDYLQKDLDDFNDFSKHIANYLKSHN